MIAIIDYGMGNLKSVKNALDFLGILSVVTKDKEVIRNSSAVILPGVGAFKQAMDNLKDDNLDIFIKDLANEGKLILGICLGMQILFEEGFEGDRCHGLGLIKGNIRKIEPKEKVKIPHMGWNKIVINNNDDIISGLSGDNFLYYVHSFMACEYMDENLIAYSNYGGVKVPGIVRKDNVIGMQFHPEKSGETGLNLLKKFGEMIK
ncbi:MULTISPECIES: imidazole glycerol phosphate synthase subunit HisH [unclassified Clostridium]|uniref:imidazole glycerol phosphate synthase subunit HisH n=1 Tax=unclassified Clostridium TaxID=2614128 RepID=UPI0025F000A1|nr:imidazole glycerol phosphate synthase subunit HisH [Clostridium sp.]MCI6692224.1 imidazole glycerol phosphate synthase subunit HisH [Clostridium sp.]MDY2630615.1 imidazole glycerol phosphate synthase subunit HisH [Clostridium sp.]MDY4251531.1 imidazole glycerol phosphate synthase subunit HisH [Clostridium sp.]MDY6227218.1 imidazole glycerol phosphate synthase subunit HisH [Clostridium sp.]